MLEFLLQRRVNANPKPRGQQGSIVNYYWLPKMIQAMLYFILLNLVSVKVVFAQDSNGLGALFGGDVFALEQGKTTLNPNQLENAKV